jgi:thioredoxin 1
VGTKGDYSYQRWKNELLKEREVIMADEGLLHVTDGNFEPEILKSDIPVMVDFWAPWCGPCHIISPILEELAKEYGGKVKLAKMNVDENPATPSRYGIRGIPTVILFKDGQIFDQIIGAVPKSKVEDMIKKAL